MKVLSVNISTPTSIQWNGETVMTGIYKKPVNGPILLQPTRVENDTIADLRFHGGIDKACYLYGTDHYQFWKEKYPYLEWGYGMFGENLSVEGLYEDKIKIGDIYAIGEALVQVSQPRQPCYKLGVKFGTQKVLKEFIEFGHPGVYVRVIQSGKVNPGDVLQLQISPDGLSIANIFDLLYQKKKDTEMIQKALLDSNLAESAKKDLSRYISQ